MGQFVITVRTNGEFQFNLKTGNGRIILSSLGYSTKSDCQNGIESVRKNSQDDSKYVCRTTSDGKAYFNFIASNGQIIGTSGMHESESARDEVLYSVQRTAPDATVSDQTA